MPSVHAASNRAANSQTRNAEERLSVVLQYAQDVSPESYLQRAPTGRPKGLAPDREYVIINYLNTPGSIEETIVSNNPEEAQKAMEGEEASEDLSDCVDDLQTPTKEIDTYLDGNTNIKSVRVSKINNCFDGSYSYNYHLLTSGEYVIYYPQRPKDYPDVETEDAWIIYDPDIDDWIPFELPPSVCTSCNLEWLAGLILKNTARYFTPIEDIVVLVDGVDFDGTGSSRSLAGAFLIIEIVPGGKFLRPVKRVISGGAKSAKKIFVIINKVKVEIGKVANDVFQPNKWLNDVDEVIDVLEDQRYLDEAGEEVTGTLEVVKDGTGNVGVRRLVNWLDELPAALKTDIESTPALKQLFENADEARRLDLVNAWKLLENSARRTDIKTLKFFDDPAVVASRQEIITQNINKTFPDIPLEELTAIRHYTTNAHGNLNKALRGEIPMTDEYRAFEELLNSGMDKLPKYNGDKVFRGIKGNEAALAKTWKVGDEVPFSDFKSSSTELSAALKPAFMDDVLYEIVNPKGYNICGVSCLPDEAEILFKSGAKFEVVDIKDGFKFLDPNDPLTVLAEGRKVFLRLKE